MGLGSEIRYPEKTHSGSRIQGSRHRILDPRSGAQHCWECYTFSRGEVGIWCLNIIWSIFENFNIRILDEHFGLNFRELRNNFLGLKYLNSLMLMRIRFWECFWPWIRDGKTSDPGSEINILDTQHWYKSRRQKFSMQPDLSLLQSEGFLL